MGQEEVILGRRGGVGAWRRGDEATRHAACGGGTFDGMQHLVPEAHVLQPSVPRAHRRVDRSPPNRINVRLELDHREHALGRARRARKVVEDTGEGLD